MSTSQTRSVGIVGLGYWGPNLARNFAAIPESEVTWLCDSSEQARDKHGPAFPGARTTARFEDLLGDQTLDAIVLATDVPSHAPLAIRALAAGKHCFVEKPLAGSLVDAEALASAAAGSDRVLMVGHLLEYHPGVRRMMELVESGDLGELRYVYTNRLNLGKLRSDENALWSLGAHDVSVLLALIGEEPFELWARGECYMNPGVEDVVFGYLRFRSGISAHLHLSWLDPHKERRLTVVGSERMATFDDMKIEGKLAVYDKGFDQSFSSYGEYIARSGDIWLPSLSNEEPLRAECKHFLQSITQGTTPRTGAVSGLRVVRVLDALQSSLEASRVDAAKGNGPARV